MDEWIWNTIWWMKPTECNSCLNDVLTLKSVEVNQSFFFNYDSKNDKFLDSINLILIFDVNDV